MIVGIAIETETDPIGFVGSAKLSVNEQLSVHAPLSEPANGSGSDPDAVVMCTVIRPGEIAAATTAAAPTAATTTAKCRKAIEMDWIEVRRMLVIADPSIRIIPATFDPATRHTVKVSAEGMKSVIANTMAAADSSSR
jgi:hypothetical protein